MALFICQRVSQKHLDPFSPPKKHAKVYAGQPFCMICREELGQKDFTIEEKEALQGEKIMKIARDQARRQEG